jgi:DNA polymerase (family 10)
LRTARAPGRNPGERRRQLPRRKEIVGDLDFIVATNAPENVSTFFVQHEMVESVMVSGATKSSVRFQSGIQADLRVVKNASMPLR